MKQCTTCGAWISESDISCPRCKKALYDTTSPTVYTKRIGRSGLLLSAAILFSIYVALETFSIVTDYFFNNMIDKVRRLHELLSYLEITDALAFITAEEWRMVMPVWSGCRLLGMILPVLTMCGLWLFYNACRRGAPDALPKAGGLALLKISPIVKWVGCLIGIILCTAGGMASLVCVFMFENPALLMLTSAAWLLAIAFALMLVYYRGVWNTVSVIREAAGGRVPKKNASMYMIVWNFILIVFTFLKDAFNIFSYVSLSTLGLFCQMIAILLLTIALLRYRSKRARAERAKAAPNPAFYAQPVYQQPQYVSLQPPVYNAPQQPAYPPPQYIPPQGALPQSGCSERTGPV